MVVTSSSDSAAEDDGVLYRKNKSKYAGKAMQVEQEEGEKE